MILFEFTQCNFEFFAGLSVDSRNLIRSSISQQLTQYPTYHTEGVMQNTYMIELTDDFKTKPIAKEHETIFNDSTD